jgi:hexosaminidase
LGYKGIVMTSWSTSGVYSPSYESEDDLVDLAALRHVYPVTGFDILVTAYFKALEIEKPVDVNEFIANYCRTRFGFDGNKAKLFQKALFMAPYTVYKGIVKSPKPMTIKNLLDSAQLASKTFHSLNPLNNGALFEPFRLMADTRVYYLNYMEIEYEVNSDNFNSKDVAGYLSRLKNLMAEEPAINKRFTALNQDMLYPAAINEENVLRNQKTHILYNRLARVK